MEEKKYGEKAIEEAKLETWENPSQENDYIVNIEFPEFTCLCPQSGYPDFAVIRIKYMPDKYIVELKSLKLYLNSYRNRHITHEEATNRIYNDLEALLNPKFIEVTGEFNIRGGIKTTVRMSSDHKFQ
ncbi:MAG TPA: NADPH-dependent 7-cyano-7-deazaguanine reductase QueF [Thermoplasmatales archaeon]|nr:NADPH-dependent 7-cyano-7-deazaguanine reductase QueF [Thermoplasmata archaeon]RLF45469.1 MAG: NADPH-dependent 7-cyano-7-deazaguanine reductase QueF [Thermoplasmata archaeon]HHH84139.1 NADPH-dependent 7-cyano-7-deazaguanine reductase QueF [Thermoplasmatales archaeon]